MISWQAWICKFFCRFFIKRAMKRPSPTPMEGILKLRRTLALSEPASRAFRRGLQVTYRTSSPKGEWIVPPGAPTDRAILYVHGGAFVACSPLSHRRLTTAIARQANTRIFSLDYRLAPEHPFPAALDDCIAAYDLMVAGGIPPSGIIVMGDSAGGGLALSTALALTQRATAGRASANGRPVLAGVLAFSPWTDLLATGESIRTNEAKDDMLVGAGVADSARQYAVTDADVRNPLASPLYGDLAGFPPTALFASKSEILRDDSVRFADRLTRAGGRVDLVLQGSMPHVWPIFYDVMPEAKRTVAQTTAFVRRMLDEGARHYTAAIA